MVRRFAVSDRTELPDAQKRAAEKNEPPAQKVEDFLSPASFIRAALAADPAFRFAILAAGVLAIVVTFVKFGVSYPTLVFGSIALIGLMVLFVVFAQASKLSKSRLDKPAQVLVWSILVIAIAIVLFLTGSVFFNHPLPFREWIIQQLAKKPDLVVVPPVVSPASADNNGIVQRAVILTELTEAYKATAMELGVFDDWGQVESRQTLRVNQTVLTATIKGRDVSMSIDPNQLPIPQYYDANSALISTLGSKEAPEVIKFYSAYKQYRQALIHLTSNPTDFNGAFLNANLEAREAVTRGRAAICTMGGTPPRIFPDQPGGFREPVPPNCSAGPFAQ
jgi:hypothetical protein